MKKVLFNLYRIVVPKPLRTSILKKDLRRKILDFFAVCPENEINDEQRAVLKYLEKNPVTIFPYSFTNNYSPDKIKVFFDPENRMHYVLQEGKRLYFKKRWTKRRIQRAYSDLSQEQDINCPHRYISEEFYPEKDDVLADIGVAEGNFALSAIEKVKKIYLFEYDREWIKALELTFAPWKDKIEIINKYVSDTDDNKHIKFDTFFKQNSDVSFLKIDVDGFERKVLKGCRQVFHENFPLKVALCTYHKNNDEKEFSALLEEYGFNISYSKGYMIYYYDKKIKAPWLRRGLIRATR